jgi:folylpolyglutamate synthase/dihydropteroate synthase
MCKFRFVVGFSEEKDIRSCLQIILAEAPRERVHFVQSEHMRSTPLATLEAVAGPPQARAVDEGCLAKTVAGAIRAAENAEERETVVVCGSVYLMGEVKAALGMSTERDVVVKS